MAKQWIASLLIGVAVLGGGIANWAAAGDCIFGCWDRPTCGKVCKLVCGEKTLVAVGYGCKCNTIAVPCPSCEGCKHCVCQCCPPDACGPCGTNKGDVCCGPCCPSCEAAPAKITFCWHDFFTCGGACPRTVKVLTKYQAEKKISWYHWEVVGGCSCCPNGGCGGNCGCAESADAKCPCIYKAAPADAEIGQTIELSAADRVELTGYISTDDQEQSGNTAIRVDAMTQAPQLDEPSADGNGACESQMHNSIPGFWQRLADMLPTAKGTQ
jgi:hypothetical protein